MATHPSKHDKQKVYLHHLNSTTHQDGVPTKPSNRDRRRKWQAIITEIKTDRKEKKISNLFLLYLINNMAYIFSLLPHFNK